MPDVSAALVVLAGAVLVVAGVVPSPMTDRSRQRIVGLGYLLGALGVVAWVLAFAVTFIRLVKSINFP